MAEERMERVILVGVNTGSVKMAEESLAELEELVNTAGAEAVGTALQNLDYVNSATYVGSGKVEELRLMLEALEADAIVCDDELTPAQMRNLSQELECKVVDRTMLILDIFAMRASTAEGRLQVELAQLRYRMTMLSGKGTALSRLGGGIGTRGPGEKKLETDRRLIRAKIGALKDQLEEVTKHRSLIHESRKRTSMPVAALVGYTNAGKSTLLNHLTGAGVLSEDKLFATLDPTTRAYVLPDGQEVLLTDTVGFIRKLPHNLVEAFKSTLEEAKYADIILHVVDASNPQVDTQMAVVYETLRELKVGDKKIITLFNKSDKPGSEQILSDHQADHTLRISAKTGLGFDELNALLQEVLTENQIRIERTFPYQEGGKVDLIRRFGKLLKEEYRDDGIYVEALVPPEIYGRM